MGWKRHLGKIVLATIVLCVLGVGYDLYHGWHMRNQLVRENPDTLPTKPDLVALGVSIGKPAYQQHCAACHGADLEGNKAKGAPDLADHTWLYEKGRLSEIERTIVYGIRSGYAKSRNVTDMPAIGVLRILTPDQIRDVRDYVFSLEGRKEDPAAVARGAKIFQTQGNCYDCHAPDARGNPDYGAPSLTDNVWLYGGDPKTVYDSIYDGRHGVCPGWLGKLDFATIRGIATYIYEKSHATENTAAGGTTHTADPG